ncbi:MAG: hypothetical protein HY263_03705 [Chloroflexi bacterium]|nr:hypothetical protein [Chloroflexota bacterium]
MGPRAVIIGGVIASLVLAMWEMIVEAVLPAGAGVFGPPIAIGATMVRSLQGSANPIPFDLVALLLGLAGHMMNSVILASVFGLLVARRALGTMALAGAGAASGVAVFIVMWYGVVPAVDPLVLNLNGGAFLAGHLMWGAALGLVWASARTRGVPNVAPSARQQAAEHRL